MSQLIKKLTALMAVMALCLGSATFIGGCKDDSGSAEKTMQNIGREMDNAVEDAGEKMEEAAEEAGDAVEEATD